MVNLARLLARYLATLKRSSLATSLASSGATTSYALASGAPPLVGSIDIARTAVETSVAASEGDADWAWFSFDGTQVVRFNRITREISAGASCIIALADSQIPDSDNELSGRELGVSTAIQLLMTHAHP